MKRFIILSLIMLSIAFPMFCQEEDNSTDENQKEELYYSLNGKGDQFIKIGVAANFPLNFDDKLYVGGAAQLGYYRFLNSWLALGGELMVGYNPTLGSNSFTFVPITFGVVFQPSVWKIEFPSILSFGFAFETCQNKKRFPDLLAKAEIGAFYRITDGWSCGIFGEFTYLPQWWYDKDLTADPDNGLFIQAGIAARYHF